MLSVLTVAMWLLTQAGSASSQPSPAETAFKTLLDLGAEWSGTITIGGKDVIVKRLEVTSTQLCEGCKIASLAFTFTFDGDYTLPRSNSSFLRAVEPRSFRVQSSFHGTKGVGFWSGTELVLNSWREEDTRDKPTVYVFELTYWKSNAEWLQTKNNDTSLRMSGSLTVKDKCVTGELSAANMPAVKFSFCPISKK